MKLPLRQGSQGRCGDLVAGLTKSMLSRCTVATDVAPTVDPVALQRPHAIPSFGLGRIQRLVGHLQRGLQAVAGLQVDAVHADAGRNGDLQFATSAWRGPQRLAPTPAYRLPSGVLVMMLVWLLLCASGLITALGFGSIANAAHIGGLLAGCLAGLLGGALARRHR